MLEQKILTVILAAGKGTRMQSDKPKVLHELAGRSMVGHVLVTAQAAGATQHAVVVGDQAKRVAQAVFVEHNGIEIYEQKEQLGTAHAVLAARHVLENFQGIVLVLYGDVPLIEEDTLKKLSAKITDGCDLAVLGFHATDPTGYGRLLTDENGAVFAIREHKDASDDERKLTLCNSGIFAFHSKHLLNLLDRIDNNNANQEYYLTDVVELAKQDGLNIGVLIGPEEQVLGVNSKAQLSIAEYVLQNRLRHQAMAQGATLIAPETVFFSFDTQLGRDVIVEPNVVFAQGVRVEQNVHLRAFSYLENCHICENAIIGPYARIRPESVVGPDAKIGNFVEVKKAIIEEGAKVNHLSYIGDARVGAKANVGAGTIICNYDGFFKHQTDIGAGAFVGSNSALIAPVKIGDGAYIGSGSVITKNVPADALAITRAKQLEKAEWAYKYRSLQAREKERRKNTTKKE